MHFKHRYTWAQLFKASLAQRGSGMEATAEQPSQAEKAEPDLMFSYFCSKRVHGTYFF